MEKTETIDLKDLEKQINDMENDDLQEFFLLIQEVQDKIFNEMKKRVML